MAQLLGNVTVGSIVKLNENGSPVDYLVVHQGKPSSLYDASCDGTWLLRKDLAEKRVWDSGNSNVLESSDIHSYLNNTWINRYDTDIRNAIKQVKIPYRQGGGHDGTNRNEASGLSCKIFLLSDKEVGWDSGDNQYFPNNGAKLSYFLDGTDFSANQKRVAMLNGRATDWWLRSQYTYNNSNVWYVNSAGGDSQWSAGKSCGVRSALILPTNLVVPDDGLVFDLGTPTLTVPLLSYVTQPFTVSWTSVDSADSYTLQRNIDNSTWETVYTGLNLSYQDIIASGSSVQYRVCAIVDGISGDYSDPQTVSLRQPSPIPTLTMPGTVDLFTTYTISWNVVDNADGYIVQKQVNDGDWTQVYTGNGTSFQDSTFYLSTKYRIASTISAGDGYQSPWSQEYQLSINMSGTPIQMTINQDGSYNELYPTTLIGNILGMDKYGYSQQQILSNTTKGLLGLEDNAIPDQAFSVLQSAINSGAKIETGSYTGTGAFGSSNPNVLELGMSVYLLFITGVFGNSYTSGNYQLFILGMDGQQSINYRNDAVSITVSKTGASISWYANTPASTAQANVKGETYRYIAVGVPEFGQKEQ